MLADGFQANIRVYAANGTRKKIHITLCVQVIVSIF